MSASSSPDAEALAAVTCVGWFNSIRHHGERRFDIMLCAFPSTATIQSVFAEGVRAQAGEITDNFDDGVNLFSRSLLPFVKDVCPGDELQGGLALRATESEIWLYPFLFRQVCRNGAIMAQTVDSLHVEHSEYASEEEITSALEEAICTCSQKRVFTTAVEQVSRSVHDPANIALNLMSVLSGMQGAATVLVEIFRRFQAAPDQSRFSLMNAVTSLARDTTDQEKRWRLEDMGGAIGASISPQPRGDAGGVRRLVREKVPV